MDPPIPPRSSAGGREAGVSRYTRNGQIIERVCFERVMNRTTVPCDRDAAVVALAGVDGNQWTEQSGSATTRDEALNGTEVAARVHAEQSWPTA